ncbi:hypothetical protein [Mycobacterium szulgai]|uniref:Secreted protein n=1 Tax=Mycobacterium szulgai TaxID=1787 RepID=A0A1X2DJ33_MYCSZ|nr:hypothetical protein [Mycobacterium szulgai]MCV7074646.1 hypothetical protein [Mycobacterium szulgai]ORW88148.1 hypothetical protein AWC27_14525 [Mycobacterium szulgai]
MRALTRLGVSAAAITLTTSSAMLGANFAAASPGSSGGTIVALRSAMRQCDFSRTNYAPMVPQPPLGTGSAIIHRSGSAVVAEVNLVNSADPGMHFDVGLIQAPRPSSSGCGPGSPGTAFTGLDIDGSGRGSVTIQDTIQQGTTGVWVIIERPNEHSQDPAEFYTSEFVAPV